MVQHGSYVGLQRISGSALATCNQNYNSPGGPSDVHFRVMLFKAGLILGLALAVQPVQSVDTGVFQTDSEAGLVFKVSFKTIEPPHTSYLILQSKGVTQVYLELKNSQYELTIVQDEHHEIYTSPASMPLAPMVFEWPLKTINGHAMSRVLHQGNISTPKLDTCQLTSAVSKVIFYTTEHAKGVEELVGTVASYQKCKTQPRGVYWVIIPIFILCVVASRLDVTLLNKFRQEPVAAEGSDWVEYEVEETAV